MSQIPAKYYDGESSKVSAVILHLHLPDNIRITGLPTPEGERIYTLAELKISERIGNAPRSIYLPDGAKCESENNIEIDEFLKAANKKSFQGYVHLLENKFAYAVAALVITAISLWVFVEYGIPELARRAAFAVPVSVSESLGNESLTIMDTIVFQPSELTEERKKNFREELERISANIEGIPELKIVFRKSKRLGANAFALPSGVVVFTDELIKLSKDDLEVTAVMAHEVGHIKGRHSLRMVLQNSSIALIISSLTGEITSIAALGSTIPVLLINAKYSKEFETEADTYALKYLKEAGIETIHFANILERMTKKRSKESEHNYLSSHPATKKRVKRFK